MPTKNRRDRKTDESQTGGALEEQTDAGESNDGAAAEPDVYLDVPQVDVDELIVDVDDLRARVSLSVEVLDLVKLNVGADVALGKVHLDLKGVHAQAMLKVRLDRVAQIVGHVLETVDRNPEVLEHALSAVERTVKPVSEDGGNAAESVGEGAGEGAGKAIGSAPGAAERAAGDGGESHAEKGGRARKRQPKKRTAAKKQQPRKRAAKKRSS